MQGAPDRAGQAAGDPEHVLDARVGERGDDRLGDRDVVVEQRAREARRGRLGPVGALGAGHGAGTRSLAWW